MLWTTFSLNDVKAMKNRLGGTVNDVMLDHDHRRAARLPRGRRAFSPTAGAARHAAGQRAQRREEHLALGNRVSMMMAPLPVGIHDPLERYRQVRAATAQLKAAAGSRRA